MKPSAPYEELKNQLSIEKAKPKSDRDMDLIKSLMSQINDHKKILNAEFKKRMNQNRKAEVANRLRLEKKRRDRNKKIRNIVMDKPLVDKGISSITTSTNGKKKK